MRVYVVIGVLELVRSVVAYPSRSQVPLLASSSSSSLLHDNQHAPSSSLVQDGSLYEYIHHGSTTTPRERNESSTSTSTSMGSNTIQRPLRGWNGEGLKGRFIHLTDMHPDTLYTPGADVNTDCHYTEPKPKKRDRAGYWGTPMSDCDSPISLLNLTMEWLEKEWADKVDFVIWTGDNARHDEDRGHPRTPSEIYASNRVVAGWMDKIFTKRGIPVVPSLGNNDIWPHNIMYPGPSTITNEYSSIWEEFVPFSSYQVFQRGAYYSLDIIPNKLGALSLNTLYWYENNKAVEGCRKGQPGDLELDWLEVQLDVFRERGMQVWLTGHVPPSPGNYFSDCYRRYGELVIRFQDTILGQLFGHMNVDHFFWIDTEDLRTPPPSSIVGAKVSSIMRSVFGGGKKKASLADDLLADFRELPKVKKLDLDDFSFINVGPSVVPTYLPSLRVFTYNVTGTGEEGGVDGSMERKHGHRRNPKQDEVDCRLRKNRRKKACRFKKPRHSDPLSPSRTNTLWTPLGYSQFVIPDLDGEERNATTAPRYELEYMTYDPAVLDEGTEYPVPHRLLPADVGEEEKRYAPYGMKDLTVGSWLRLVKRLGKKKRLFKRFKALMYMA